MKQEDRFLINPELAKAAAESDVLVIGSGIAGLMTALRASEFANVCLITKSTISSGCTEYAQGGIAFAIDDQDSPLFHKEDTMVAGVGFCNEKAVDLLVEDGPSNYRELVELGARFDKHGNDISLHREGGHSMARVVHRGDATGAEVSRTLVEQVKANPAICVVENAFMIDLLTYNEAVTGAVVLINEELVLITAKAVIIASGGAGQLFSVTTNPSVATGDGIAAAYRAGAQVVDMEFIQFHPTALYEKSNPRFLISEAVRGEGALLLDLEGKRLMEGKHPLAELAPRDVVVRNMALEMIESQADHLYLDLRTIPRDKMENEFPTIYGELKSRGYDVSTDLIPIAFAAHYTIGGIATDLNGKTSLPNLYACGEVSCTGVHGANRLASNSLLEGLVFSSKVVEDIKKRYQFEKKRAKLSPANISIEKVYPDVKQIREDLSQLMLRYGGVFRAEKRLNRLEKGLKELQENINFQQNSPAVFELKNMMLIAQLIHDAGMTRLESRGTHQRQEYPDASDTWAKQHIVFENNARKLEMNPFENKNW